MRNRYKISTFTHLPLNILMKGVLHFDLFASGRKEITMYKNLYINKTTSKGKFSALVIFARFDVITGNTSLHKLNNHWNILGLQFLHNCR